MEALIIDFLIFGWQLNLIAFVLGLAVSLVSGLSNPTRTILETPAVEKTLADYKEKTSTGWQFIYAIDWFIPFLAAYRTFVFMIVFLTSSASFLEVLKLDLEARMKKHPKE